VYPHGEAENRTKTVPNIKRISEGAVYSPMAEISGRIIMNLHGVEHEKLLNDSPP
jgi:hypothetical protein